MSPPVTRMGPNQRPWGEETQEGGLHTWMSRARAHLLHACLAGQGWGLQVSTSAGCWATALHRSGDNVLRRSPCASTQRTSRSRRPPPQEALHGPKSPASQLRSGRRGPGWLGDTGGEAAGPQPLHWRTRFSCSWPGPLTPDVLSCPPRGPGLQSCPARQARGQVPSGAGRQLPSALPSKGGTRSQMLLPGQEEYCPTSPRAAPFSQVPTTLQQAPQLTADSAKADATTLSEPSLNVPICKTGHQQSLPHWADISITQKHAQKLPSPGPRGPAALTTGDTVQGCRTLAMREAGGSLGTGQSPPTAPGPGPGSRRIPSAVLREQSEGSTTSRQGQWGRGEPQPGPHLPHSSPSRARARRPTPRLPAA